MPQILFRGAQRKGEKPSHVCNCVSSRTCASLLSQGTLVSCALFWCAHAPHFNSGQAHACVLFAIPDTPLLCWRCWLDCGIWCVRPAVAARSLIWHRRLHMRPVLKCLDLSISFCDPYSLWRSARPYRNQHRNTHMPGVAEGASSKCIEMVCVCVCMRWHPSYLCACVDDAKLVG